MVRLAGHDGGLRGPPVTIARQRQAARKTFRRKPAAWVALSGIVSGLRDPGSIYFLIEYA